MRQSVSSSSAFCQRFARGRDAEVASLIVPGNEVCLVCDSGDTLFFGSSSLSQFAKSYSQHITLK